ncbi:MAG: DUF4292 domain-containing protein [Salibacteraceae bacterium]
MTTKFFYIVCTAFALISCRGTKETQGDRNLPNIKTAELLGMMEGKELKCDWMSLKYDVVIKSDGLDDSFKMYVRLKQDSVIWISATYYAVEVARFLLTPDSVQFMDRKNNEYYQGEYDYAEERFGISANFEMLQSLILANAINMLTIEAEDEKIRTSRDDGFYYLSIMRKGQVRRAFRREEENTDNTNINLGLWIEPKNFRVAESIITDFDSERTLKATYSDYQKVCNSSFPYLTEYVATSANEQFEVKTSVIKLSSGKKVSLSFTIPDKYEKLAP